MDDENLLGYNFWPSFSDLMLAIVLILTLVLFVVTAVLKAGSVPLGHVKTNQQQMINAIARFYGGDPRHLDHDLVGISLGGSTGYVVIIRSEPTLQRITFSGNILFEEDQTRLNDPGRAVLATVASALKQQLNHLREIQIQGHADTVPTRRYQSNMHLAALRAIAVFQFLQEDAIGIDPTRHLISATSFGEFKPVQRSEDYLYDESLLQQHNSTEDMKYQNRRIEMLLFYRH